MARRNKIAEQLPSISVRKSELGACGGGSVIGRHDSLIVRWDQMLSLPGQHLSVFSKLSLTVRIRSVRPTSVYGSQMSKYALWVAVAFKVVVVGCIIYALTHQDLPQFQNKGLAARSIGYPLICLIVPAIWAALRVRRGSYPFPAVIDALVTLPFMLDLLGNVANLYDSVGWFDDVLHFINWIPLVTAFGLAISKLNLGRMNVFALCVGFGSVTHTSWEISEYFGFINQNPSELVGIYKDTIGDLALSLTGSTVAAFLVSRGLWSFTSHGDASLDSKKSAEVANKASQ